MRRNILSVLAVALTALVCIAAADKPATSASMTGNWKWTLQVADGNGIDMSAEMKQDGAKLTGVFLDGFDQQKFDVKNGVVKDGNVSFTITRPINDATITVNYSGKLDGDVIKGTVEFKFGDQDPMKNDWEAKRVKEGEGTTKPATQP